MQSAAQKIGRNFEPEIKGEIKGRHGQIVRRVLEHHNKQKKLCALRAKGCLNLAQR